MRREVSIPKHPNTGDAGSPRRPRDMDARRRAAWDAAFEKLDAGLAVTAEEHAALLRPGLFKDLDAAAVQEEADYVVRYWLHGFDWSLIAPRGPTVAAQWHLIKEIFSPERAEEALRNYIQASEDDPDYWEALDGLAVWHHEQGRPFPAPLAAWAIQRHRGELPTPPQPRGDHGRPAYAQANRNLAIAEVFHLLGYLGLHNKNVRYSVIAEEFECKEDFEWKEDAVRKAVETHARRWPSQFPRPWECWPAPTRKARPHSGLGAARGRVHPTTAPPVP